MENDIKNKNIENYKDFVSILTSNDSEFEKKLQELSKNEIYETQDNEKTSISIIKGNDHG